MCADGCFSWRDRLATIEVDWRVRVVVLPAVCAYGHFLESSVYEITAVLDVNERFEDADRLLGTCQCIIYGSIEAGKVFRYSDHCTMSII